MTVISRISLILGAFVLVSLSTPLEARESKQKRKENALNVRKILRDLPRINDAYRSGDKEQLGSMMKTLGASIEAISPKLSPNKRKEFAASYKDLLSSTQKPKQEDQVYKYQKKLGELNKTVFNMEDAPAQVPDNILGKDVYLARCALCHGKEGEVDSALAKKLHPAPKSFRQAPLSDSMSAFRAYNVLITGIEDTSKVPLDDQLSDHELWSVAFYVMTLGCADTTQKNPQTSMTLRDFANATLIDLKPMKQADVCVMRLSSQYSEALKRK